MNKSSFSIPDSLTATIKIVERYSEVLSWASTKSTVFISVAKLTSFEVEQLIEELFSHWVEVSIIVGESSRIFLGGQMRCPACGCFDQVSVDQDTTSDDQGNYTVLNIMTCGSCGHQWLDEGIDTSHIQNQPKYWRLQNGA